MMRTTAEFTIPTEPGLFRVEHRSADWRQDVATGSAILQVQRREGGWLDYMTIRSEDEVERIDRALHQALQASVAKTPAEAGVEPAARWCWSDADIRKALRKGATWRSAKDARSRARARWDDLIATTQQLHGVDLVTACLVWLDPDDLASLAKVGIGGFGERIAPQEVA